MKISKLILLAAAILFTWTGSSFAQQWTWTSPGAVGSPGASPSISAVSSTICWVAGGASGAPKVYKSTDGGVNFTDVTGNITGAELYCVWGVDGNIAFVGDGGAAGGLGGNAKVWKTTNGGTSWTTILTTGGTAGFLNGIVFSRTTPTFGIVESDPPTGFGNPYWVQKTTDGGLTWALTPTNPPGVAANASAQNSIVCVDANHFGFGTSPSVAGAAPARIIFTTNGGTSWNTVVISATGSFTSCFAMASDWVNGVAGSIATLPVISRTTNGGAIWTPVTGVAGMTGTSIGCWVATTQRVYVTSQVGAAGCVEQSTDGGATWSQMNTSAIISLNDISVILTGTVISGYAIGTDGSVISLVSDMTGIDPNNNSVPTSYKLEQNYPNPFNPTTNIRYSLPKASNVTVKIFDILGHEVMTVVNGYQNAGNYVETVNASSLASGVYFYTIKANNFTETKKMSLVK
jgi:photosystem II stability/assembly factor-like uncharacterized protein